MASQTMAKILIAEDDYGLCLTVQNWLEFEGHCLHIVESGIDALKELQHAQYDLAILDWNIPKLSGLDACIEFRRQGGFTPILILTGRSTIEEKLRGLESGADDYLTKPFAMEELSARVRALLRRSPILKPTVLRVADLELDPKNGTVTKGGAPINLVPKEFTLLEFLMRHSNQVFSAGDLLDCIWSSESETSPDTIRPYINRLRSKIDDPDSKESLIKTVHGLGYKLEVN